MSIRFEDMQFDNAFRIDLLVDDRLIVEIEPVERPTAAHAKRLLTYLRLTNRRVGLLINFGGATLKEGIRRLVHNHNPSALRRLCANNQSDR